MNNQKEETRFADFGRKRLFSCFNVRFRDKKLVHSQRMLDQLR